MYLRYLLTGTLLVSLHLAPVAAESENERLLRLEKDGIAKIVQITAQEHSTILFTIADYMVGYVKDGQLQWISATSASPCSYAFPQLSHSGDKVLYQAGGEDRKCHLFIYDTTTHSSRLILEKDGGGFYGTSWSWDDSQIALYAVGLTILRLRDGRRDVVLPLSELKKDEYSIANHAIQWSHDDNSLIIEFEKFIPNAKQPDPNSTAGRNAAYIALVKDGHARVLGEGAWPSVSPVRDEIAAYSDDKLAIINVDGSGKRVASDAPRYGLFFHAELAGDIVWSPDGGRIFFRAIVSDTGADKIYLVDLGSQQRKLFLGNTTISICGWH